MSVSNGPSIVTSGLVLSLDAADKNSYPGSGTTWTDMSGNGYNGTLTNGPTFSSENGGAIVFDGVDDFVNFGNILSFERTQPFSVCFWVKAPVPSVYLPVINKLNWAIGAKGWRVLSGLANSTLTFSIADNHTVSDISLSVTNVLNNTWKNVCFTYDGNGVTNGMNGYLQGSLSATGGGGNLTSTIVSSTPLGIFGGTGTANLSSGAVSSTQIYNRALTASEVLQNYNATKTRFGL